MRSRPGNRFVSFVARADLPQTVSRFQMFLILMMRGLRVPAVGLVLYLDLDLDFAFGFGTWRWVWFWIWVWILLLDLDFDLDSDLDSNLDLDSDSNLDSDSHEKILTSTQIFEVMDQYSI